MWLLIEDVYHAAADAVAVLGVVGSGGGLTVHSLGGQVRPAQGFSSSSHSVRWRAAPRRTSASSPGWWWSGASRRRS